MTGEERRRIIELVRAAAEFARSAGIENILQPGLVKEMVISEILGHELILTKHDSDAFDPNRPERKFEYLSCKEGGAGQLDRVFKEPLEERTKSLVRIRRNQAVYFAVFYGVDQLKCKVIYEIPSRVVADEAERKLDRSKNKISHVGFSESWARKHGRIVFADKDSG